ncbi:MAG: hypothetical protein J1F33_05210 [Clostridiales bacterium]|nr:hypothetical protein [Clostridiales bacterium]
MKSIGRKILSVVLSLAAVFALTAFLTACDEVIEEVPQGDYALSYARGAYLATGVAPRTKYYDEGEEVVLAAATTFEFDGYTFAGWNDGENTYDAGATYTMPARDVKMTAQWTEGNPNKSITVSSMSFDDGKFVVEGEIGSAVNKLVMHIHNSNSPVVNCAFEAVITGSSFKAEIALSSIKNVNGDVPASSAYLNVRYELNDDGFDGTLNLLPSRDGAFSVGATHNYDGKIWTVYADNSRTYLMWKTAPVQPQPGDGDLTVKVSAMYFETAKFIIEGECGEDVDTLIFHLHNSNNPVINYTFNAVISDGEYKAEVLLSDIRRENGTEPIQTYINVRYERNDEGYKSLNLLPGTDGDYTVGAEYVYAGKLWTLNADNNRTYLNCETTDLPNTDMEDEGGDKTPVVTAGSIGFDEGYFVFTGNIENVTKLYVYLINTNVSGSLDNYVEAEIADGRFTARLSLDNLIGYNVGNNIPFNLRYKIDDLSVATTNVAQGSLDITQTHTYAGKAFRIGINGGCVALYYDAAPTPPEEGDPDYTVKANSMRFESGKFIVEGEVGKDVDSLVFHLNNTSNPAFDLTVTAVISEGSYKAEVALADIKRPDGSDAPSSYINVRYVFNDDNNNGAYYNLLPGTSGSFIVGQEYRYGDRTWTLKADANRTYLNYSAVTDAYRITNVKLELVGGVPTLTISGTTTTAIEASQLRLLLDKNKGTTEQKYIENSSSTDGTFSFTIDLTNLIPSVDTATPGDQQAYFIRLYNGTNKIADLNSRWASDLLWERGQIETDDAIYYLMKNTAWDNTAWNTLGVVKVDK